ncbi:hypothetical protein LTR51_008604 [Lithohypha guttulata]|nr:hypothetical protein LTR51_008604 [Lithohypha guttulata]
MSLPFSIVCLVWEQLSSADGSKHAKAILKQWFELHVGRIEQKDHALALLSCMLPHKRYDRVYGLGERQVTAIVVRAWGIGTSRRQTLQKLQDNENIDCASAIERVVAESGDLRGSKPPLTLTEVDATLDRVAAMCDFSSPELRQRHRNIPRTTASDLLVELFRSMSAQEVKWSVRVLLRDLRPVVVPEMLVLQLVHESLPRTLQVLNSLSIALRFVYNEGIRQGKKLSSQDWRMLLQPQAGTMIGLPTFDKARSITHGHRLLHNQKVSVERKYDGEYCQIHVWKEGASRSLEVKIFSKSGRDSTLDRASVLTTVRQCLGRSEGTRPCAAHQRCVLVGELVVWSDRIQEIMPFYKIRRYVTREGRRLGCGEDSPPEPDEHLMIIFHDILLWNRHSCIHETYMQRRGHLQNLIQPIPGRAELGEQIVIDFTASDSETRLAHQMAFAVTQQWEGLVLKACQDPYIGADGRVAQHVKLKKDYIHGLGDSADLAVVGGSCDGSTADSLGLARGSWTTFFLACRETGGRSYNEGVITCFHIVGRVSPPSVSVVDIRCLNAYGRLSQMPFSAQSGSVHILTELRGAALPTHLFSQPAVAEVIGAGFDRPANARYNTLRFPRILKIHHDRNINDVVELAAYQRMARVSDEMLDDNDDMNLYHAWLDKLGYGHLDCENQAVTASRASEAGDSALPSETSQGVHIGPTTGRKRRVSAVSSVPDAVKRQRQDGTEEAEFDYACVQGDPDSYSTEIPDSQPDVEARGLRLAQERGDEEAEHTLCRDEQGSEPLDGLGTVLVWNIDEKSLSSTSYAAFARLIVSQKLDVTFAKARFWSSVTERSYLTPLNQQGFQRHHLVLVGHYEQSVSITAANFMLSVLERRPSILETCPPSRVDFVAWSIVEDLYHKNVELEGILAMQAFASVIITHGTYTFTVRANDPPS